MKTAILSAGIGLGNYVPALLLRQALRHQGVPASVQVLESSFSPRVHAGLDAARQAYHANFKLALAGQRLSKKLVATPEQNAIDEWVAGWARDKVTRFLVLSGYWLAPLVQYQKQFPNLPIQMDFCHLDAEPSPSWLGVDTARGRACWMFSGAAQAVKFQIPVESVSRLATEPRDMRVVMHGGGWGLGSFRSMASELGRLGWQVDLVMPFPTGAAVQEGVRVFYIEESWRHWNKGTDGEFEFPPLVESRAGLPGVLMRRTSHQPLLDLCVNARAIVTKPGGGSLVDSLACATPLVLLEPYGPHERANGELWQALGFAISWDDWRKSGYSFEILESLQNKLSVARRTVPSVVDRLLAKPAAAAEGIL